MAGDAGSARGPNSYIDRALDPVPSEQECGTEAGGSWVRRALRDDSRGSRPSVESVRRETDERHN